MEIGGEGNKTIGKHIAIKSIEKSHGYQVAIGEPIEFQQTR
jgi:hypothetical protein